MFLSKMKLQKLSPLENGQKIYQVYRVSLRGIDTLSRNATLSKLLLLLSKKESFLKGNNLLHFGVGGIEIFQKGILYRNVNSK